MALSLSYSPTAPLAGEDVTLSASGGGASSVYRYSLTAAPDGSALTAGPLLDDAGEPSDTFVPDIAGRYTFDVTEYLKVIGLPRYPGDPAGASYDRLLSAASDLYVYVATAADLQIVTTQGHGATLRLRVANGTIVDAELRDARTDLSRLAMLDETAAASVAALVGESATFATLDVGATDLRNVYTGHLDAGTWHGGADTVNTLKSDGPPYSNAATRAFLNTVRDKLLAHMHDGSSGWHANGEADYANDPIVGPASNDAEAFVLSCELRFRTFELHRKQVNNPDTHHGTDNTNAPATANALEVAVRDFLSALADRTSTVAAGEQAGAKLLASRQGFTIAG